MNTVLPTAWNNRTAVRFTAAKLSDSFHNVGPPLNTERSIILSLHKLSSTGLSILQLCGSIFVYVGLAWYLNQALPMSDGGFFRPWYFPFTPSYWSGQGFKPDVDKSEQTDDTISREKNLSRQTGSIRLLKISKVYASTTAVKEVSLTMNTGNVYTILGHNGAGKTSLISMLSGVTNPTYGEGFVFGYDLREDVSKVQEIMGCCPQFDALYMRLTPAEHVQFYASFRGVDVNAEAGSMRAFVTQKLAAVGLVHVANSRTGSLSGGMKRRLSLILATIGQIKLVFLDEPTTGMDPMSRRKCWKVIQEMKRGKIVILTTHTMEEADALGDVVCIMHGGRLQAFGTNIFMKSFFGKGYQLSLISPTDD
ncbi:P-loop containing nucleoside triphosphate hydrolase protein, partial [Cladochytrium replicatum]